MDWKILRGKYNSIIHAQCSAQHLKRVDRLAPLRNGHIHWPTKKIPFSWSCNQFTTTQRNINGLYSAVHGSGMPPYAGTVDDHLSQFRHLSNKRSKNKTLQQHTLKKEMLKQFFFLKRWWRQGEVLLMVIISFFIADSTCADSNCHSQAQ